jgi:uncharacterized protein GlcG (DUF336 family)
MRKLLLGCNIAALCLHGAVAVADEQPLTIPIQRLSVEMAYKAAQAAMDACRKKGLNVAVTVVDRGGHPQVVLRDTLAMPVTIAISEQKAYTAMNFNSETSALKGRFDSPFAPGKVDGLILYPGAVPISPGSTIIGGIGVSGAPTGETDEECARAGLQAIITDLEMSL